MRSSSLAKATTPAQIPKIRMSTRAENVFLGPPCRALDLPPKQCQAADDRQDRR